MVVTRSLLRLSRFAVAAVASSLIVSAGGVDGQSAAADQTVARISDYVEQYYSRAQSIVTDEAVTVQRINRDWSWTGLPGGSSTSCASNGIRQSRATSRQPRSRGQLLTVNGKPPRKGDKPECMDPRSVSPEPLAFLLPERREKYAFTGAGIGRVDGRDALMVDYRSLQAGKPTVEWTDECVSVDVPGGWRGRLWADPRERGDRPHRRAADRHGRSARSLASTSGSTARCT